MKKKTDNLNLNFFIDPLVQKKTFSQTNTIHQCIFLLLCLSANEHCRVM